MRLPAEWIAEYAGLELDAQAMADRLTMAGLEVEETEDSDVGAVLNIKVTPNRGDCLSVIGVARELAASCGRTARTCVGSGPAMEASASAAPSVCLPSVEIDDTDLCLRYAARLVTEIRSIESPDWMRARLVAAGMRPINAIVDVTNYVMLETGQPLHAFDYDTLTERRIVVRRAKDGERIRTLDGVDRTLTGDALVIADGVRPVALAGIMGGAFTEVRPTTRTVLLESAHFSRVAVRRTARRFGIGTEASYRFERIVDPAGVVRAADRACALMEEIGCGTAAVGAVDCYPSVLAPVSLAVRVGRTADLLGFAPSADEIAASLSLLGFEITQRDTDAIAVTVPSWRADVTREHDLVEEVGRVLGYERIPEALPVGMTTQGADSPESVFDDRLRDLLVAAGLQEVVSHTLMAPSPYEDPGTRAQRIGIRSALSADLSGLRRSLLPGLVDALDRNARHGQSPLAFFEIGHVFQAAMDGYSETTAVSVVLAGPIGVRGWQPDGVGAADYFAARGIAEALLAVAGITDAQWEPGDDARLHPGRQARIMVGGAALGVVGEMHPSVVAGIHVRHRVLCIELSVDAMRDLSGRARAFAPIAPFPSVVRDVAPRIAGSVAYADVRAAVQSEHIDILESFEATDLYQGEPLPPDCKSLTLSFTFRGPDRTLTDAEVSAALERLRAALERHCHATFAG